MIPIQKQVYDMRDSGARIDQIRRETGLTNSEIEHLLRERRYSIEDHQDRARLKREGFELGIEL